MTPSRVQTTLARSARRWGHHTWALTDFAEQTVGLSHLTWKSHSGPSSAGPGCLARARPPSSSSGRRHTQLSSACTCEPPPEPPPSRCCVSAARWGTDLVACPLLLRLPMDGVEAVLIWMDFAAWSDLQAPPNQSRATTAAGRPNCVANGMLLLSGGGLSLCRPWPAKVVASSACGLPSSDGNLVLTGLEFCRLMVPTSHASRKPSTKSRAMARFKSARRAASFAGKQKHACEFRGGRATPRATQKASEKSTHCAGCSGTRKLPILNPNGPRACLPHSLTK